MGGGAVRMCVTGIFALTMTLDDAVVAPVLRIRPFSCRRRNGRRPLHVTPGTLEIARCRIREKGLEVLALRFTGDVLFCRSARFDCLRRELGDDFEATAVLGPSARSRPEPPRSVLTVGLADEAGEPTRQAVDRVIGFLRERLCG